MSTEMRDVVMTFFIAFAVVAAILGVALITQAVADNAHRQHHADYVSCVTSPSHAMVNRDCVVVISTPIPRVVR